MKRETSYKVKELGATKKSDKMKVVAEMVQGFLKGANVGSFNFTALLECIYEADQDAEIVYVVFDQIIPEAIHNKEYPELLVAGFFLVSAVQTFRTQVMPVCEQVDKFANWNKFESITSNMYPGLKLSDGNIMFNGQDVTEDFKTAAESLEDGDFFDFGDKIGAALAGNNNMFIF
jgi:hypothetical protein